MAVAALLISILALVASCIAAWYTRDQARSAARTLDIETERHANEIAERERAAVAGKTALMSIALDDTPERRNTQFVLNNRGGDAATDLNLTFVGAMDGKPPPLTQRWKCPAVVHPGEPAVMNAHLSTASSAHFEVRLDWLDGRGRQTAVFELGSH